jgi:hypothetical protein
VESAAWLSGFSGSCSGKAAGFILGWFDGREGDEFGGNGGGGAGERGGSAARGKRLLDFDVGEAAGQGADRKKGKKGGGGGYHRGTKKEMAKGA